MKNHYNKEPFTNLIKESKNLSDACRKLGIITTKGNRDTIKKYIEKYELDVSHFTFGRNPSSGIKKELIDILVENSTYNHTTNLKNRLYKEGLLERKCVLCGQDENWNGMKISLILDHINGINNDNRIENLRIVCPNCDAGLPTFSGKNLSHSIYNYGANINYDMKKQIFKKNKKCGCGELISNNAKMCKKCSAFKIRKVERPTYEQLLNEISELGFKGTGRKYGVSDNSIRKWKKNYEK